MKTREVAEKMHALGFTARSLYHARQLIGVKYRRVKSGPRITVYLVHPKGRPTDHERRRLIAELRAAGMTYREIGERFGITWQAVQQSLRTGRSPDRRFYKLEWVDPDTGERKSKTAKTADAREAEAERAKLQYELNHGLAHEPSHDWAEDAHYVYHLPPDAKPLKEQPFADYVFLHQRMGPWKRFALGTKFRRLRLRNGLPADMKLCRAI
jgi:hypothetical protein